MESVSDNSLVTDSAIRESHYSSSKKSNKSGGNTRGLRVKTKSMSHKVNSELPSPDLSAIKIKEDQDLRPSQASNDSLDEIESVK